MKDDARAFWFAIGAVAVFAGFLSIVVWLAR